MFSFHHNSNLKKLSNGFLIESNLNKAIIPGQEFKVDWDLEHKMIMDTNYIYRTRVLPKMNYDKVVKQIKSKAEYEFQDEDDEKAEYHGLLL